MSYQAKLEARSGVLSCVHTPKDLLAVGPFLINDRASRQRKTLCMKREVAMAMDEVNQRVTLERLFALLEDKSMDMGMMKLKRETPAHRSSHISSSDSSDCLCTK